MKNLTQLINEAAEKIYVNIILLSPTEDSILILKRTNYNQIFRGKWGFPGGSLKQTDKDTKAGALRELKEETSIELTWNEEHNCKKFDTITNKDGSTSEYFFVKLDSERKIKLSKEHSVYEWYNEYSKKTHKWMPDIFQIIQKILD